MPSWSTQIGGVAVTFRMGHVNELRGVSTAAQGQVGAIACPTYSEWLLTVPGIPAGWGRGQVLFHNERNIP